MGAGSRDMVRLFIAVELPEGAGRALAGLLQGLREARLEGVRPVATEGIHLTLRFLGNVPRAQVEGIAGGLAGVGRATSPFEVALGAAGGFPDLRRPRALWVGLEGDTAALEALRRGVEGALERLGHPRETRPFSPHLTLARVREWATGTQRRRAGEVLAGLPSVQGTLVPVDAVSLMQSTLRPQGALYTCLHREPLLGAPAQTGPVA